MIIRESNVGDIDAIRRVHEDAFDRPENETVAQVACNLLADETARPLLSRVAEIRGNVVGHIIFSSVRIEGNEELTACILAPLAVLKDYQKQGVGQKLIEHGLRALEERGTDIVLVLGDPGYYARAGFVAGHKIEPPYKLDYSGAWMARELEPGTLAGAKGVARCASSLASPELW
jgi:predicted N-acetyltransferase YhbS